MNDLSASSTPQLRVVSEAFSHAGVRSERSFSIDASMPARLRTGSEDRAFVQRGVEALARYSYSHVDQSATPWQEGIAPPTSESQHDRDERFAPVSAVRVVNGPDETGAMSYSAARTLDAHGAIGWSAPNSRSNSTSLMSIGETSDLSIVRSLARFASPVLEMADGLRALKLNQVQVGDGLTLKLDGRTGRHARCFAILTQRF